MPDLTVNRESRCPLCGQANGCVPAETGTFDQPCWCTDVKFSPEVLAKVPEDWKGKACLCRACALAEKP